MFPAYQGKAQPPPDAQFIPADELSIPYLHQVLRMTGTLALQYGIKYVIVGWYSNLGNGPSGIKLCADGCLEGMRGTYTILPDVLYMEALVNESVPAYETKILTLPREDGRSIVVLRGDAETRRHW